MTLKPEAPCSMLLICMLQPPVLWVPMKTQTAISALKSTAGGALGGCVFEACLLQKACHSASVLIATCRASSMPESNPFSIAATLTAMARPCAEGDEAAE